MSSFVRKVGVLLSVVAFLVACGGGAPPTAQPAGSTAAPGKLKVLRMALASETISVDPAIFEDPWSIQPTENLFDALTQLDADYKIKPAVAKEWSVSPDGLVWTFKLRNDVKFSNGDQVTAKDFKYAINRIAWPETKAPYVFLLDGFQGIKDVKSGASKDVSGVKVIDDYTLQITLSDPEAYLPAMTATWVFSPISQKAVEAGGADWATPGKLVNNGAFLLKSWDRPTKMVLEANPNYYAGKSKIDQIEINIVKDPNTALLQYENGELDVVDVPDSEFQRISKDSKLSKELQRRTLLQARWIAFNVSKPPFNNQKLREAIAYSIDRKKIADQAFSNTVEPNCQEIPAGLLGDKPSFCWPDPDPAKAKQLLSDAGFPAGTPPPAVKFALRSIPAEVRAIETVTSQIKAATGWDIPLDAMTAQNFSAWRKNGQPNKTILEGTWGIDYFDTQDWLDPLFATKAAFNYSDLADPDFDALVKKGNATTDAAERLKIYTQAEQLLLDKMYVIPMYQSVANWLTKPNVHGFKYSISYWPPLKDVTID